MSQPVAIMSNNNYICCIISVINKQFIEYWDYLEISIQEIN